MSREFLENAGQNKKVDPDRGRAGAEKEKVIFTADEQTIINDIEGQGKCRACGAESFSTCTCLGENRSLFWAKMRRAGK